MSIPKGKRVRIDSPDEGILYGVVIGGNSAMGYGVNLDDGDTMIVSHHYLTLLEEIDKPRIKKSWLFGWWCEGCGCKGNGDTPEKAYTNWQLYFKISQNIENLRNKMKLSAIRG